MGSSLNGEVLRRRFAHRNIADLDRRPQAAAVGHPTVQRVRSVKSGSVGGIEQPGAGQLNRRHVDPADDQHQGDDSEPEDEQADLAPFALFSVGCPAPVGTRQPLRSGAAQATHAVRAADAAQAAPRGCHLSPPNRSTVAMWVADIGI